MSTIGHPLSDISNLLTPYFTARLDPRKSINVHPGFKPRATRGLPTPDEITTLYFSVATPPRSETSSSLELSLTGNTQPGAAAAENAHEHDRQRELQWAQAFNMFRLAAICQGIAARQAGRQASSEEARRYADARGPMARFAWELVKSARSDGGRGAERGGRQGTRGRGGAKL
jgi:aminoglycoside phosphotransferase (APT) family kinase protein